MATNKKGAPGRKYGNSKAYGSGHEIENPFFPEEQMYGTYPSKGNGTKRIVSPHGSIFDVETLTTNVMDERLGNPGAHRGKGGRGTGGGAT